MANVGWITNLSPPVAIAAAAGAGVLGAGLAAMTTRDDGTRRIGRHNKRTLYPTSEDSARKSITFQRVIGAATALGGAALLGVGLFKGKFDSASVVAGAALLGYGAGKLGDLADAGDKIDGLYPEHTAPGEPDMRSLGRTTWSGERVGVGTGYNAFGYATSPWWDPAPSTDVSLDYLDQLTQPPSTQTYVVTPPVTGYVAAQ